MPVPGWNVTVKTRKLASPVDRHGERVGAAVSQLIWTAASKDAAIAPGEFMEFPVSLGPLPKTFSIAFATLQTYSNGEVVEWTETPADGDEPEHPAPLLALAKAPAAEPGTGVADRGNVTVPVAENSGSGGTPLWLGILALLAGLVGLGLGVAAYLRARAADAAYEDELDDEPEDDDDLDEEEPPRPVRRPSPH